MILTLLNMYLINPMQKIFNKLLTKNITIDEDGLVDSVRMLTNNHGKDEQYLLQMLLHPY